MANTPGLPQLRALPGREALTWRVRLHSLDAGGYNSRGVYFGRDRWERLYAVENASGDAFYFRAASRGEALALVRAALTLTREEQWREDLAERARG